ncbi:hypothetical protein EEJ42_06095 [Streptomyces botrytidirepellens]|uniref:Uncharacterized protein n=1 Tax=Streptomyces botrytidirepellens TaxID=2486417 RepID=A0A3M8X1D6_9ACTN|nr:hypothetical protein EEJ42_06095 [Streptomyces botrytidirepellens]
MSLLALGVAVAHLVAPDLKIDNVTVALLVIAVVPWLRELFTSIELPGGLRVEFRDVEQRIEAAEAMADAALVGGGEGVGAGDTDDPAALADVRRLAAEYLAVRADMRAGSARTQRMNGIFARLVRATQRLAAPDLAAWLASPDGGLRLAAYARLYAVPDAAALRPLADAVTDEPLAFGQYWGIRALDKAVDLVGPDEVPPQVVRRLEDCRPNGADRAHLLDRLIAKIHALT